MQRASFPESENMPSISNDSVTLTNTLAAPTLDLAALPTLKVTISGGNRLRIERLDAARNVWTTIYDALQPTGQNRLLDDGFGLSLRVNTLGSAMALSFQTQMHVQIDSETPIVLQDDCIVGGNLQVTNPRLINQARLTAESFSVVSPSFESTASVRANGLNFKVHDFKVSGSLYSGGDCRIQHGGGAWNLEGVEQCLEVGGRLILDLKEGVDIGQKVEAGSAVYSVDASAVKPLRFLKEQTLEDVGIIGAPHWQNEAPLTARRLEVRTANFNNRNTIHTQEGYLKSSRYTLVPEGVWHSRGDLRIDQADALMAHDFSTIFQSLETLGVSLNNGCALEKPLKFPGSLRLAVLAQPSPAQPSPAQPSPAQPLILLADVSVEKKLMIDSQVPVRLGDAQHTPTLSIKEECHIQSEGAMPYEDKAQVPAQSGCSLRLMSELNGAQPSTRGILYVSLVDCDIQYRILSRDNQVVAGRITAEDLGSGISIPADNNIQQFESIKKAILDVTSKRGHTPQSRTVGIFLHRGRLLSLRAVTLKSSSDIALGLLELHPTGVFELPKPGELPKEGELRAIRNVALGSKTHLLLETPGDVLWHQVEIQAQDLEVRARYVDNLSSSILIEGNAILPDSCHHLISAKVLNAISLYDYKIYTVPAEVQIKGDLRHSGVMKIIGSQVSTHQLLEGDHPTIESVFPYNQDIESYPDGEHRKKHKFHSDTVIQLYSKRTRTNAQTEIKAAFSVSSALTCNTVSLRVNGLSSALSMCLRDIHQGQVGHVALSFRLPVPPPFRPRISLMDYFQTSAFVELQMGGDTVYRSLLGSRTPRLNLDPIIVLHPNRTVSHAVPGMRRLLTLEQEEQLLVSGLMDVLGRHFLGADCWEPTQMLSALKHNAARLAVENNTRALILRHGAPEATQEPFFYYQEQVYRNQDSGVSETVLIPDVYLPAHFDNRHLRDGAGALFALGPITFEGVDGATLSITSHIDAEGLVTYQNFNVVSRTANTFTHYETVRHETTQRSLLGHNQAHVDYQQVAVRERQPGNETRARGERYVDVNHVHRSGANDILGEDGLRVEGATSFVDEAIVYNAIGPIQSDRQRALLGGGTRTTHQPVVQRAMGSRIQSTGPVYIQAALGVFDATDFGNTDPHFEIPELHFHELLRALEAQERAAADLLREQRRTARRRERQGMTWMLLSLPVSYYLGGVVQGWLQSAMGLGATTTAAATAGVATTATTSTTAAATATGATIAASTTSVATEFTQSLVLGAARGAAMGGASAGIRGANPIRGLVEGAAFGALGRGVNSVLGESAQTLTGQTIHAVSSATLETTLHGGNILENVGIAVAANAVAHTVLPMDEEHMADLSPTQTYARAGLHAALASGTVAALNGSSDFVMNTFIGAVGAVIEPVVSARGQQMGERVAQRSQSRTEGVDTMRRPTQARRPQIRRDTQQSGSSSEVEQALLARGVQALRARGEVLDERALLRAIRTTLATHSPESLREMGEQAYATDPRFRREVMRQWQQSQVVAQGDARVVLVSAAVVIPLAVQQLIAATTALSGLIMIRYNRSQSLGSSYQEPTFEQIQRDNAIPLEYIPGRRRAAATMGFMPLFEGRGLGPWNTAFPDHSGFVDQGPLTFPIHAPELQRWINPAPDDRTLTRTQVLSFPIHQLDIRPEGRPIEAQGLQFMYRRSSSTTDRPHAPDRDRRYINPPETKKLAGFPNARNIKGKNPRQGGGGLRERWELPDGTKLEWDYQHGTIEKWNKTMTRHLGEFDPGTGRQINDSDPDKKIPKPFR